MHKREQGVNFQNIKDILTSNVEYNYDAISTNLVIYVEKLLTKKSNKAILKELMELSSYVENIKIASSKSNSEVAILKNVYNFDILCSF